MASRNVEVTVHIADLDEVRDALEAAARLDAAAREVVWVCGSYAPQFVPSALLDAIVALRTALPTPGLHPPAREEAPEGVRCDCWLCGGREPDGTLHGANLHASYGPAPSYRLVQVTGSLEDHPGHVCFSDARYDGLRDWWDGLDDAEKREAYLVEKGNADALAASIERQP